MASGQRTGCDWALAGAGLALIAILLVIGAVAWVHDIQAARARARRVAKLVDQVKRGEHLDDQDAQRPGRAA